MRVRPARQRPSDRVQTETDKTPAAQVQSFPAPIGGLVTNAALSSGAGAVVLENFWPTPRGIEPRGGLVEVCTIGAAVKRLFQHRASGKFFAANTTGIYEFSDASTGALSPVVSGQTSGEWSNYETQTSGGSFLTLVNGVNKMQVFNGTAWQQVTAVSVPLAITGIDTALLYHVWGHRNRLFFVQKGTLTAWYLGVNSIAGAATALPLTGVFRKGGSLLMGGTWSSDSGDGIDDRCVFVTDAGEVAIYAGNDPGDVNNWSLQGIYDIGDVMGREAAINIAGDLAFGTIDGIIPLSAAVSKDPAQLKVASIASNIAPDWARDVALANSPWRVTRWPRGNMLIATPIGAIADSRIYVSNLSTGAWATITGWNVGDIQALGTGLYLGSKDGTINRAWLGGTDKGAPFVCRGALSFDPCGNPAAIKVARAMRTVWRVTAGLLAGASLSADYGTAFPMAPDVTNAEDDPFGVWDVSLWGLANWGDGGTSYNIIADWHSVSIHGFAFSPQVQITSNSSGRIGAILERIDLTYMQGAIVQ